MNGTALKCELCEKVFTGECNLQQHLLSEKHKKKVLKQKILQSQFPGNETPECTSSVGVSAKESSVEQNGSANNSAITANEHYCELCKCWCNSVEQFNTHILGINHKKKCKLNDLSNISEENNFYCEICDVSCSGPMPYKQHMDSVKHLKKKEKSSNVVRSNSIANVVPCDIGTTDLEGLKPHNPSSEDGGVKRELKRQLDEHSPYICTVCDKVFTGDVPYLQHLDSMKHRKKARMSPCYKSSTSSNSSSNTLVLPDDADTTDISDSVDVDMNEDFYSAGGNRVSHSKILKVYHRADINIKIFYVTEKITFKKTVD